MVDLKPVVDLAVSRGSFEPKPLRFIMEDPGAGQPTMEQIRSATSHINITNHYCIQCFLVLVLLAHSCSKYSRRGSLLHL